MHRLFVALALAILPTVGCGLFDEKAPTEATPPADGPAPVAEPAEAPAAAETPPSETPADATPNTADHYRAFIVLDTSVDRTFFVPEDTVQSGLEGKNILYLHAYSNTEPFSVTDPAGKVLGTLDIKAITDAKTGYIFVESGRPSDYLAPAAMPFVFQQATAYFREPLRASASTMTGQGKERKGRAARKGLEGRKGKPVNTRLKSRTPVKGDPGQKALGGKQPGVEAIKSGAAKPKEEATATPGE